MDKNHPGQNLPDKRPLDKSPREQLRENLYRELLSGIFVLGLLKIGGPGMCDKVWEGEGVKIGQKKRDVLYGRPPGAILSMLEMIIIVIIYFSFSYKQLIRKNL